METDKYTFRLPEESITQLDELIKKNIIKNRTEGVIKGIQCFYEENTSPKDEDGFFFMLKKVFGSPSIVDVWDILPTDQKVVLNLEAENKQLIGKLNEKSVTISRIIGNEIIHVDILAEPVNYEGLVDNELENEDD